MGCVLMKKFIRFLMLFVFVFSCGVSFSSYVLAEDTDGTTENPDDTGPAEKRQPGIVSEDERKEIKGANAQSSACIARAMLDFYRKYSYVDTSGLDGTAGGGGEQSRGGSAAANTGASGQAGVTKTAIATSSDSCGKTKPTPDKNDSQSQPCGHRNFKPSPLDVYLIRRCPYSPGSRDQQAPTS